jgi:serine/threonine-protein kinase
MNVLNHTKRVTGFLSFLLAVAAIDGCKKSEPVNTPPVAKRWHVTTIAGNGSAGFSDGSLVSAEFKTPTDIAAASDGTLYITDAGNNRIRKIVQGQVSTFAGNGQNIFANGNGMSAQFMFPYTVALDDKGNLYVSDLDPRMREISPAADVSTLAGTSTQGFADGDVDTALFYPGNSMIADAPGNIYISDNYNCRIRKISAGGKVTTIAGDGEVGFNDGNGTVAEFHFPGGIVMDHQGNLFVADRGNNRIRKIAVDGQVSTFAGFSLPGDLDGRGSLAQFMHLSDLVIDNRDNIYATDEHRIRQITPDGVVSTIAGTTTSGYKDGEGTSAQFNFPSGLGIDARGNIYVADTQNNRIRKISFE